jgi:predicted AlkP superfamily pyrophosphatase or phosphodiesterase
MGKTILVLIDGCSDILAKTHLGYLEHLAEAGVVARYTMQGELPSSSRPMYETLLTGLPIHKHGITSNLVCQNSKSPNIFSLCRAQGLKTAAAAYYWMCELYANAPFIHTKHRMQFGADSAIQNGIYYFEDNYPDTHVLCEGEYLRSTYDPDFLLLHTMNIDDIGHKFGEGSKEQAACAMKLDVILGSMLPALIKMEYHIIVTSDYAEENAKPQNLSNLKVDDLICQP